MRKSYRFTPIVITAVFAVIIFGVFQYRQRGGSPVVSLSEIENTSTVSVSYISGKININTASADELTSLPGIGEKLSVRIVAYREENGPFANLSDLKNISGIGESKLNAIKDYITLGG